MQWSTHVLIWICLRAPGAAHNIIGSKGGMVEPNRGDLQMEIFLRDYWQTNVVFSLRLKWGKEPMTQCKTAVSPLLTHWRYCRFAFSHRNVSLTIAMFVPVKPITACLEIRMRVLRITHVCYCGYILTLCQKCQDTFIIEQENTNWDDWRQFVSCGYKNIGNKSCEQYPMKQPSISIDHAIYCNLLIIYYHYCCFMWQNTGSFYIPYENLMF